VTTSARKFALVSPLPPLEIREHVDFGELGIPYYDEELDLAQGQPHFHTVGFFTDMMMRIAEMGGYGVLGDNPIWYWENDEQKAFCADLALAETNDPLVLRGVTADQLLLACEVVTTSHPAKLKKDTEIQLGRNEAHGVPEFLLLYPDLDDDRVLEWFTLINGRYTLMQPRDGCYRSRVINGMVIQPLAREAWQPGRKFRVSYRDMVFRPGLEEFLLSEEREKRIERKNELLEAATNRANREARRRAAAECEVEQERQKRIELERRLAELKGS